MKKKAERECVWEKKIVGLVWVFIDSSILKRQAEITLKYLDKRKESPLIISIFFSGQV